MWRIGTGIILLVAVLTVGSAGCGSDSKATDTESSSTASSDKASFGKTVSDGLWKLNDGYKAGLYRAPGGKNCHWAALKKSSGGVIESGGTPNTQTLQISSPYFETKGCGTWDNYGNGNWKPTRMLKTIPDGIWKSSDDFAMGLYQAPGGKDCNWATLRSAQPYVAIFREGGDAQPQTLEIRTTYFRTEGCGTWRQVNSKAGAKDDLESAQAKEREAIESASQENSWSSLPPTVGDGISKLDVDYKPALYRAPGGENCHWALLEKRSGGVVESGGAANTQTLQLTSPYFESKGCGTWDNRYTNWKPTQMLKTIPDGIWKSSDDFELGLYRAPGGDDCNWATLSSAHPYSEALREGDGAKPQTVQILTPYFRTEGCGTWRKIG